MAIITISRELGSVGNETAQMLKDRLGYGFLDKESLEEKLEAYGVSKDKVERFDERKPGIWDALSLDRDRYLHFLKTAVIECALDGNAIILGRGSQVILGGIPGVLRMQFTAPPSVRIQRISRQFDCDEEHAEKFIQVSDHNRTGFHKYFFHVDWHDSQWYDLVVNTAALSAESAADLVCRVLELDEFREVEDLGKRRLNDLFIAQQVKTEIVYERLIPVQLLEVHCENAHVTLHGTVVAMPAVKECEEAARMIAGVEEVTNHIHYIPSTYGLT